MALLSVTSFSGARSSPRPKHRSRPDNLPPLPTWLRNLETMDRATFLRESRDIYQRWRAGDPALSSQSPPGYTMRLAKKGELDDSLGGGFVARNFGILLNQQPLIEAGAAKTLEEIVPHESIHAEGWTLVLRLLYQAPDEAKRYLQQHTLKGLRDGELDSVMTGLQIDPETRQFKSVYYMPAPPLTPKQRQELCAFVQQAWDRGSEWLEEKPDLSGYHQLNSKGLKVFQPWLSNNESRLQKTLRTKTPEEAKALILEYVQAYLSGGHLQTLDTYKAMGLKLPPKRVLSQPLSQQEKENALNHLVDSSIEGSLRMQYMDQGGSLAQAWFAYHIQSQQEREARLSAYEFQLRENRLNLRYRSEAELPKPQARALRVQSREIKASQALVKVAVHLAKTWDALLALPKNLRTEGHRFALLQKIKKALPHNNISQQQMSHTVQVMQTCTELMNQALFADHPDQHLTLEQVMQGHPKAIEAYQALGSGNEAQKQAFQQVSELLGQLKEAQGVADMTPQTARQIQKMAGRLVQLSPLEKRLKASPLATQLITQYRRAWQQLKQLAPKANNEFSWILHMPETPDSPPSVG